MPDCPNCRQPVPIRRQWWRACNWLGLIPKGYGLRCEHCRTILAVRQEAVISVGLVILAVALVAVTTAFFLLPSPLFFIDAFVLIVLIALIVYHGWAVLLAELYMPVPDVNLLFDWSWEKALNEDLEELRALRRIHMGTRSITEPASLGWSCAICGDENPRSFESCRQCFTVRADPSGYPLESESIPLLGARSSVLRIVAVVLGVVLRIVAVLLGGLTVFFVAMALIDGSWPESVRLIPVFGLAAVVFV